MEKVLYHLAQINIAKLAAPLDSPQLKDFVDNLDPVNQLAESASGFIWRLQDEAGDATHIKAFDDPDIIINMSTWTDVESLKQFMFKTVHRDFMRRKREWFIPATQSTYALWWVPAGHQPSVEEAVERLNHLRDNGLSAYAFDFREVFSSPE